MKSAGHDGRYQLLARIAAGGMGEVYLATDSVGPPAGRRVALKLLLPHLSDEREFVDMFLDEAKLTARLQHPHIPQVLDVGLAGGRYYLAIELIEGVSTSQLLRACRRAGAMLPAPVVRLCARGLCEALEYAHELKDPAGRPFDVVHRDVSPSNLLVSTGGRVLLNDFGIARARGRSHATRTGEVKGKFAYMPPEQLDLSAPVDRRADVYSAALTLYELATLESPFLRETEPATIDAVRLGSLPDVTQLRADLTPAFSEALSRATARRPADRFPTAKALLDALLDGEVARPEELGRLVDSLCAEELAVFRRGPSVAVTRVAVQTASMLSCDEGAPTRSAQPPRSRHRRAWPLAVAGGLVAGLVGWRVLAPPAPPAPEAMLPAADTLAPDTLAPDTPALHAPAVAQPVSAAPVAIPRAQPAPAPRHNRPAASPAAKSLAASAEPGFLSLDAHPWAEVFIDGQEIDRTPIARYPLPPGRHSVVFKNPERDRETTRVVTVESGKAGSVLVDLE